MDKEQGASLAWLAELPRLGLQMWKRQTFHWFENVPDEIWRDGKPMGGYVRKAAVESNLRRKAKVLKKDLERINEWFEQYEVYKKKYIESKED